MNMMVWYFLPCLHANGNAGHTWQVCKATPYTATRTQTQIPTSTRKAFDHGYLLNMTHPFLLKSLSPQESQQAYIVLFSRTPDKPEGQALLSDQLLKGGKRRGLPLGQPAEPPRLLCRCITGVEKRGGRHRSLLSPVSCSFWVYRTAILIRTAD